MIEFTLDDNRLNVEEGTTILGAAKEAGIWIPTLCHDDRLKPFGACRICLVEVETMRGRLLPACSTPVENNMVVKTSTHKVIDARKTVLELLCIHHPLDCPVCDKAGECELQDLVFQLGVTKPRFKGRKKDMPVEEVNPFIRRDYNRCILCGKCVRICDEVQNVQAISFVNRGFNTKIDVGFDQPLDCVFCGHCISVCPVGALSEKGDSAKTRSWFIEKVLTTCTYCGVGCQLELNVHNDRIVKVTAEDGRVPNKGSLCVKGKFGYDFVHHPDRLTTPLIRREDSPKEGSASVENPLDLFRPATWDDALDLVAGRLKAIMADDGPDSIAGLTSARCTNEENYLMQKFMRAVVGTNNIDHCARL